MTLPLSTRRVRDLLRELRRLTAERARAEAEVAHQSAAAAAAARRAFEEATARAAARRQAGRAAAGRRRRPDRRAARGGRRATPPAQPPDRAAAAGRRPLPVGGVRRLGRAGADGLRLGADVAWAGGRDGRRGPRRRRAALRP